MAANPRLPPRARGSGAGGGGRSSSTSALRNPEGGSPSNKRMSASGSSPHVRRQQPHGGDQRKPSPGVARRGNAAAATADGIAGTEAAAASLGYPRRRGAEPVALRALVDTDISVGCPVEDNESLPCGNTSLSATAGRYLAVGVQPTAPRMLADGCRWIGGPPAEIDPQLIRKCTESAEDGKIVELNFHFKFISSMDGLAACAAHLRSLDLSSNNIRKMEGLNGMVKLRELKLYGCQIQRIENLEQCHALAALHLEDNCISGCGGLDGPARSLEYLNLDKNKIQQLGRTFPRMTKLKELHIAQNQLVSLEGVTGLPNLEQLNASHNQIREIGAENLKGLAKLDELVLAGNQIQSLGFLTGAHHNLPSLSTLDLSSNLLSADSLRGIPSLPQLVELNVSSNKFESIPSMHSLASLEILDLSHNHIENVEDLQKLDSLSLKELMLQGNPLVSLQPEYSRALATMPSLEYVDDSPVTPPAERENDDANNAEALVVVEDLDTFRLTNAKTGTTPTKAGGLALNTSSRPGSGLSRPGTGGSLSRPGTGQEMLEAGLSGPLMNSRIKLLDRRFAPEEQVAQWTNQTLSGLAAIGRQVEKTSEFAEAELRQMSRFIQKAQRVFKREEELQAIRKAGGNVPSPVQPVEGIGQVPRESPPQPESARARRLREAVGRSREGADVPLASSPSPEASLSPRAQRVTRPMPPAFAAAFCDEEIESEDDLAQSMPAYEPPAEEVDEASDLE